MPVNARTWENNRNDIFLLSEGERDAGAARHLERFLETGQSTQQAFLGRMLQDDPQMATASKEYQMIVEALHTLDSNMDEIVTFENVGRVRDEMLDNYAQLLTCCDGYLESHGRIRFTRAGRARVELVRTLRQQAYDESLMLEKGLEEMPAESEGTTLRHLLAGVRPLDRAVAQAEDFSLPASDTEGQDGQVQAQDKGKPPGETADQTASQPGVSEGKTAGGESAATTAGQEAAPAVAGTLAHLREQRKALRADQTVGRNDRATIDILLEQIDRAFTHGEAALCADLTDRVVTLCGEAAPNSALGKVAQSCRALREENGLMVSGEDETYQSRTTLTDHAPEADGQQKDMYPEYRHMTAEAVAKLLQAAAGAAGIAELGTGQRLVGQEQRKAVNRMLRSHRAAMLAAAAERQAQQAVTAAEPTGSSTVTVTNETTQTAPETANGAGEGVTLPGAGAQTVQFGGQTEEKEMKQTEEAGTAGTVPEAEKAVGNGTVQATKAGNAQQPAPGSEAARPVVPGNIPALPPRVPRKRYRYKTDADSRTMQAAVEMDRLAGAVRLPDKTRLHAMKKAAFLTEVLGIPANPDGKGIPKGAVRKVNMQAGKIVSESGFLRASYAADRTRAGLPVMLTLLCDEGTPALPTGDMVQGEMLLGRGASYMILGAVARQGEGALNLPATGGKQGRGQMVAATFEGIEIIAKVAAQPGQRTAVQQRTAMRRAQAPLPVQTEEDAEETVQPAQTATDVEETVRPAQTAAAPAEVPQPVQQGDEAQSARRLRQARMRRALLQLQVQQDNRQRSRGSDEAFAKQYGRVQGMYQSDLSREEQQAVDALHAQTERADGHAAPEQTDGTATGLRREVLSRAFARHALPVAMDAYRSMQDDFLVRLISQSPNFSEDDKRQVLREDGIDHDWLGQPEHLDMLRGMTFRDTDFVAATLHYGQAKRMSNQMNEQSRQSRGLPSSPEGASAGARRGGQQGMPGSHVMVMHMPAGTNALLTSSAQDSSNFALQLNAGYTYQVVSVKKDGAAKGQYIIEVNCKGGHA